MKRISALALTLALAVPAHAQQPLSAIDWLDQPGATPVAQTPGVLGLEPPVSTEPTVAAVDVMPLDQVKSDAVGLLPAATTGLPLSLWQATATETLVSALDRLPSNPLPAVQALYYSLLLAEADAPYDASNNARFLKSRVEALMGYGAIKPALALIERAGPDQPELYDLWLDLALLEGAEDPACAALRQHPDLSPRYSARIYCTARAGDWQTAALTFDSALAVGAISGVNADLLAMYLDPEQIEAMPSPPPPRNVTPLVFRLFEAAGAPLPTARLPRAFAVSDLRGNVGWRAEIEAAERLVRVQAVPSNRLLGLYTDRRAAASGGVWDRVRAIQKLESALETADTDQIAALLPDLWKAMRPLGLEVAFAQMFGPQLSSQTLPAQAGDLALRIGLLSPEYESIASQSQHSGETKEQAFLLDIARGMSPTGQQPTALKQAIADAFAATAPAPEHQALLDAGQLGLAILSAAQLLDNTGMQNPKDVTAALRTLRAVGLEDTARRAALQLLLLESG